MSDKLPTTCSCCGRELKARKSVKLGVGPECAEKQIAFTSACGSTLEEIASLALLDDPTVARWIRMFAGALRVGRIRDGKAFIDAARRAAADSILELNGKKAA